MIEEENNKSQQGLQQIGTAIKVEPVKVPTGAKQIGNYILGKTIGRGSSGNVHLGLHIPTGEKVAVKIIQKQKLQIKDKQRIMKEIQISKMLYNPHLLHLYEIIQTEKSLLLITEFMPNGELFNHIIQQKKLPQQEACHKFQQIISAIEYMHRMGIVHRDIKPENILIDYNGNVKIIDFGLSTMYEPNQKLKTWCGSPCYTAPEIIAQKHRYVPLKIDLWSCGIVLFCMLTGYLPFCDPETSKLYQKIVSGNFRCPTWISQESKQLICSILKTDPSQRISIEEIKSHKWFNICPYKPIPFLDPRKYKIPVQLGLLNHFKRLGLNKKSLQNDISTNKKTKQTAHYFMIAKKLLRQGKNVPTLISSPNFDQSILRFLQEKEEVKPAIQVAQKICIDLIDQQSPLASAQVPNYQVKSVQFKYILKEFLICEDPCKKNMAILSQKQKFYDNLNNQKKNRNITIQPSRAEKAKKLIQNKKGKSSLVKISGSKKQALECLHNLNTISNPEKQQTKNGINTHRLQAHSTFLPAISKMNQTITFSKSLIV